MDKVELPLLKGENKERYIPYVFIIGFSALFIIFLILVLSLSIKKEYSLNYNETSYLDYNVYLKPNEYYDESYLGQDNTYISSIVDTIQANFTYSFDVLRSKNDKGTVGLEYNYYIDAAVEVNNSSGKNIYTKTEKILNNRTFDKATGESFKIDEPVSIDYQKYNKIAQSFIDNYGLTADANLVVTLYASVVGTHSNYNKKINDSGVISMSIPLAVKTFEIEKDGIELSNRTNEVLQYRDAVIRNKFLFVFAIILAVVDLAGMVAIVIWVIKSRDSLTLYKKKLEKIVRDYDRYISETVITERVEDMMKTQSLRIELVKSFEGLMDIRDNLSVPILYHEERPGLEAVFYIVTDQIGYIYIMKATDFEKNK